MTEEECANDIVKHIITLEEKVENLEGYLMSVQKSMGELMIDYPKANMQWVEERLRAVELQVKELRDGKRQTDSI